MNESNAYLNAMIKAEKQAGFHADEYWADWTHPDGSASRIFSWSYWLDEQFDPWWYRHHPKPLAVDGKAYRHRQRNRRKK